MDDKREVSRDLVHVDDRIYYALIDMKNGNIEAAKNNLDFCRAILKKRIEVEKDRKRSDDKE